MGLNTAGAAADNVGDLMANALIMLMRKAGMPNGLAAVGYGPERCRSAGGRYPAATQRYPALAASCERRRSATSVPRIDDALVGIAKGATLV